MLSRARLCCSCGRVNLQSTLLGQTKIVFRGDLEETKVTSRFFKTLANKSYRNIAEPKTISSQSLRSFSRRKMTTKDISQDPHFRALLTPELEQLSDIFNRHGFEIRIAGGAVRDLLRGLIPADVDFATTATPPQMKEMFTNENIRMINALGEKHGTITARINDKDNFEITTLRIDKVTDGRRAEVEFTKDWEVDANRRDLTVNSLFLGLDGTVYDYFNGQEDLKAHHVRFVGDPVQRIQEDYLRILRYFRFYGRISECPNNHCEKTLEAIRENAKGLAHVSGERIWMEWKKILVGNFACELTLKMIELGLAPYIGLPEKPNTDEFSMVCRRMKENNVKLEPQTLFACLLSCEDDVMALHNRLHLSGVERDTALFVVNHRETKPHSVPIRPYQYLMVDSKNKFNDTRLFISEVLKYRGDLDLCQQFMEWNPPKFSVTGHHLKDAGCPPGKLMSVVLGKLKDQWKESNFEMSEATLVENIPSVLDNLSINEMELAHKSQKKRKKSKEKLYK